MVVPETVRERPRVGDGELAHAEHEQVVVSVPCRDVERASAGFRGGICGSRRRDPDAACARRRSRVDGLERTHVVDENGARVAGCCAGGIGAGCAVYHRNVGAARRCRVKGATGFVLDGRVLARGAWRACRIRG